MKYILIILLCASFSSQASQVLKCLGKEEAYIHKQKIGGAFKRLNQDIIGKFLQLGNDVEVKQELLNQICHKHIIFPSLIILEKSILPSRSKELIFKRKKNSSTKTESDLRSINKFHMSMFNTLVSFLARLQSTVVAPKCLLNKFPGLQSFYEQSLYVLEEQGQKRILKDFKNLPKLFNKIKTGTWDEGCQKQP